MSNIINRLVVKPQLSRKCQAITLPKSVRLPSRPPTTQRLAQNVTKATQTAPVEAVRQQVARPHQSIITDSKPPKKAPPAEKQIQMLPTPRGALGRHGIQAVIRRPRALRRQEGRKSKGVRYITPDVSGYEQEKIRNMRGRGAGKILLIIGNGPSISEAPLEMLRDHPYIDVMSINKPDDRLWPTAYWAFFDQSQLRRHNQLWDNYNGVIFNSTSIKASKDQSIKIKNLGCFGFSKDLMRGVNIGRSSVYAAMQIGLWLDFRHIYIFGCDMCEVGGKTHFYGVNPDAPRDTRLGRFDKEAEYYADAGDNLDEETRQRFTFCSAYNPYSFVEKFGRMDHREAVPKILEQARTLFR